MHLLTSSPRPPTKTNRLEIERRLSPRRSGNGIIVLFEVPSFSRDFCWPGRLVDISRLGLAMRLLPELRLAVGTTMRLSMVFEDRIGFDGIPSVLVRQRGDLSAVRFDRWSRGDEQSFLRALSPGS